jgi:hypothetical protein
VRQPRVERLEQRRARLRIVAVAVPADEAHAAEADRGNPRAAQAKRSGVRGT